MLPTPNGDCYFLFFAFLPLLGPFAIGFISASFRAFCAECIDMEVGALTKKTALEASVDE